jgi:hypothetical protein
LVLSHGSKIEFSTCYCSSRRWLRLVHMQAWRRAGAASGADSAWRSSGMGNRFNSIGEGFILPPGRRCAGTCRSAWRGGSSSSRTCGNRRRRRQQQRGTEESRIGGHVQNRRSRNQPEEAERKRGSGQMDSLTSFARPCGGRGRRSRRHPGRSAPPPRTAPSPPSLLPSRSMAVAGSSSLSVPTLSAPRRRCGGWFLPLRELTTAGA